ncbi:MAG: Txe/YoeB family addiction module toxin [Bacteroidetes bacterium]|nr:Txe/YoeB family addiction module toxin [Bacteroidota bacterium]
MKRIRFEQAVFDDLCDWAVYDKKRFSRIHDLLRDILRNPFKGAGKPEPLKGELKGYWSRRIDEKHRIVYKVDAEGSVDVISCKGHYGDK